MILEKAKKTGTARAKTSAEQRKDAADTGEEMMMRRKNAEKLIKAGAVVTVGTDNYSGPPPPSCRGRRSRTQDHGIGTVLGIEGLVERHDADAGDRRGHEERRVRGRARGGPRHA
ncbi:MAG: hypothetical protein U0P30_00120 [Vicinamibacterales bacterium]